MSGIRLKYIKYQLVKSDNINVVEFSLDNIEYNSNSPFYSVVIGPNGTGKSFLLSLLVDTFREIMEQKSLGNSKKSIFFKKYKYTEVAYEYEGNPYELVLSSNSLKVKSSINEEDYKIPERLLALSFLINDKFPHNQRKKENNEFYQYLGIRETSNASFTNTAQNKTAEALIENCDNVEFIGNFNSVLKFLGYTNLVRISFTLKGNTKLYVNKINTSINSLNSSFYRSDKINDWDAKKIDELIHFVKDVIPKRLNTHMKNKELFYDLRESELLQEDYIYIQMLRTLKIIETPQIILKRQEEYNYEQTSSGEKQIIYTMVQLLSQIEQNSLVLIDEPEISLHPNWQMKYMDLLSTVVKNYSSCHFIIATHSHFLLSELKISNSSIISTSIDEYGNRATELHNENTFGWSVEDILYNIFNVVTNRNMYVARDIDEILRKVSIGIKIDVTEYQKLQFISKSLKKDDPISTIINKLLEREGD